MFHVSQFPRSFSFRKKKISKTRFAWPIVETHFFRNGTIKTTKIDNAISIAFIYCTSNPTEQCTCITKFNFEYLSTIQTKENSNDFRREEEGPHCTWRWISVGGSNLFFTKTGLRNSILLLTSSYYGNWRNPLVCSQKKMIKIGSMKSVFIALLLTR